jgi:hypothetical protein
MGVVLFSVLFFPMWWRLNKRVRLWLGLAAAICLSGAVGLERIGGAYYEAIGGEHDLVYEVLTAVEESARNGGAYNAHIRPLVLTSD